jgi:hypothetical protein
MERKITIILALAMCTLVYGQFNHQRVYSTFDQYDLNKADTFNNGADGNQGFKHYNRFFNNAYDDSWGSWTGWSLSNMTDDTTQGYLNQYSAITSKGLSGTPNYMVGTTEAYIKLDSARPISGAYFTNNTYAYFDMLNGSSFSKKFGGADGTDPDYFKLTITTYLAGVKQDTAVIYLADYRFADSTKDFILNDWKYLDFNNDMEEDVSTDSITFAFESSDNGTWGMNTPAYFCMDDFNAVSNLYEGQPHGLNLPDEYYKGKDQAGGFLSEYLFFPNKHDKIHDFWSGWSYSTMKDDTTEGYGNQFSCINDQKHSFFLSSGTTNHIRSPYFNEDNNFLYKTGLPAPWSIGLSITNSTYAYLDMKNGSSFSKKFGGVSGNDPDYFRVNINYIDSKDSVVFRDTVYLADFRFADNSKDYILKDWIRFKDPDFTKSKGEFHRLEFNLESSDTSQYGINTPSYFCLSYEFRYSGIGNQKQANYKMYPNPASSEINIVSEAEIDRVEVLSFEGELVKLAVPENRLMRLKLNLNNLAKGMYFVRIHTAQGIQTKKLIKQ